MVGFEIEIEPRWFDVDVQGVLNHAVYLSLFEEARYRYFTTLGLMRGVAFPFLLAEIRAGYRRPGRPGMRLVIGAATVRLGGKSLTMAHHATPVGEEAPLVEAEAVLVHVDEAMRSSPLPEAFRAAVAGREGIAAGPG